MKKLPYSLILLLLILTTSCSRDDENSSEKFTKIQYIGSAIDASTAQETTRFTFTVTSKCPYSLYAYVEAITIKKEKLTSPSFILQVGETKDIFIQKLGLFYDKEYIQNYKVQIVTINYPPDQGIKNPVPTPPNLPKIKK